MQPSDSTHATCESSADDTSPTELQSPMNVMTDESAPVFLVGATRSGTTLLRLMLDHHPQISHFGEFEYAVHQITDAGLPDLADYYRYLELDRMYRVRHWDVDHSLDYVHLIRSFLQQAIDRSGKPLGGATVHSKFDELPRIWPNARYIHIVRDPRDVSRSCIGMGWVGNVYYGTEYWLEPIRRWNRLAGQLAPDRQMNVRYEDLICNTESELVRICEFIGTDYDNAMLDYADNSTYGLPEPSLTEQWRRKLSPQQIQQVESVCHVEMKRFGYEPASDSFAKPSGLAALRLSCEHRARRIQRNVKVYGLTRYFTWQLAKRFPHCELKRRIIHAKNAFDQENLR